MKSVAKQAIRTLGALPGVDRLLWHGGQYLDERQSRYLSSAWQSSRINGHFTSAQGDKLALVSGLRDQIKPNWRVMLEPGLSDPLLSAAAMKKRLDS